MDFFEKFGDKILYFQSHRSGFDPELTVEELAKAIESRVLERIPLALKKSLACEHRDSRGWPYSGMNSYAAEPKSSLKGIYEPISYRYCPLCGDKLEG